MAAGRLPAPGTELGPCADACHHIDCAKTREMAEQPCRICGNGIGYGTFFYHDLEIPQPLAHATCLEQEVRPESAGQAARRRIWNDEYGERKET